MRLVLISLICGVLCAQAPAPAAPSAPADSGSDLRVEVNQSTILENASGVHRVLIGNPEIAEAIAVSTTEVVVNGKAPGTTTLMLWANNGERRVFDIHVLAPHGKLDLVLDQLSQELPGQKISLKAEEGSVFLRGTVSDLAAADRAVLIASALGKVVDLLNVQVAPSEPQILLRVRFVNIDRQASLDLGANFFSTGAGNTIGGTSTEQFSPPTADKVAQGYATQFSLSDALNVLLFDPKVNLGATIRALQQKQLAEILAEPNLLTLSGKAATFLSGGEFPYPTLQGGGAGVGQITIQFREFGVRLYFLPTLTPRGTIRLVVIPEVSSLDFANGLTVQGFTVPGLATRRVQTEIELGRGQSFAIAGLLDNRLTETISKVPGLGNIPLLGKLFQSKSENRTRSELLVLVTPELVDPISAGGNRPDLAMPKPFLKGLPMTVPGDGTMNLSPALTAVPATVPAETMRRFAASPSSAPASPATNQPPAAFNPAQTPAGPLKN